MPITIHTRHFSLLVTILIIPVHILGLWHEPTPETLALFKAQDVTYTTTLWYGFLNKGEDFSILSPLNLTHFDTIAFKAFCNNNFEKKDLEAISSAYSKTKKLPKLYIKFVSPKIGYGAFAGEDIEAGTLINEYTGTVHTRPRWSEGKMLPNANYMCEIPIYFNSDPIKMFASIDSYFCGNETRYINHNLYEANVIHALAIGKDHLPHLCFFALRKIYKDEELLLNYFGEFWKTKNTTIPVQNPKISVPPALTEKIATSDAPSITPKLLLEKIKQHPNF